MSRPHPLRSHQGCPLQAFLSMTFTATFLVPAQWQLSFSDIKIVLFTYLLTYVLSYYPELFLCRLSLPDPYVGPDGVDFICSQKGHGGMTHCANEIPIWIENGRPCNGSPSSSLGGPATTSSCVNWNQFYTVCKTGLSNPYRGSISFDNIGLAWVAIFQVPIICNQIKSIYFRHKPIET